ncbi:hypothetical protein BT93_K1741 [Corymbia citriodora subsp. variegata]|nr:hypothetical protein BT93_K1741 [Corymbia citriodora subsp. variegata]
MNGTGTGTDRSNRDREGDDHVDRISGLPNALLIRILTFLGTRDAIRTSMLHRPFDHLWKSLSHLAVREDDFDGVRDPRARARRYSRFLFKVFTLLETREIESFIFNVDFHARGLEYDHELADMLDMWMLLPLERRAKHLSLMYGWPIEGRVPSFYYRLPSVILRSTAIVGLHLSFCNVQHLGQIQIQLPSLQTLTMTDVNLSDELLLNLPVRPSFRWNCVTMVLRLAKRHLPGIAFLLKSCCCLETLTFYVYPLSAGDIEDTIPNKMEEIKIHAS